MKTSKLKKEIILLIVFVFTITVVVVYNKNIYDSTFDDKVFSELISELEIKNEKSIYLLLKKDYLDCVICRDNFSELVTKLNEYSINEKLILIMEKSENKKWSKKRLTFYLSKLGFKSDLIIEEYGVLNNYLPANSSFIVSKNKKGKILNYPLPLEFEYLDTLLKHNKN